MSDDQDTTAPGRVNITIKRVEVSPMDPDYAIHRMTLGLGKAAHPVWASRLGGNLADAALEEMRVRAALKRAGLDPNGRRLPSAFDVPGWPRP